MLKQLELAPKGETVVRLVDQYPLYELGLALQDVKSVFFREGVAAVDQVIALISAETKLTELLGGHPFEISYCRSSTMSLLDSIEVAVRSFRDADTGRFKADAQPLENWRQSEIKTAIEVFEHQFSAELKKQSVYAVPRRGIFDTEKLVDTAEEHLPESIRSSLPKFVVAEFREAGRCLAFGLFSAAGFHALRAAEKALRQYHAAFIGDPKKDDMTMGLMASQLRDRLESNSDGAVKPNAATIRTITDIVSFDRNPLTHKELQLEEDDAAMLFNRAQGMISLMARELIDRADELQPNLPLVDMTKVEGNAMAVARGPRKRATT